VLVTVSGGRDGRYNNIQQMVLPSITFGTTNNALPGGVCSPISDAIDEITS
jgi:hypothetical protein